MPYRVNEVPDTPSIMPNSADKMPDNTSKVPDTAKKVPDTEQEQYIYQYVLENDSITTNKVMELVNVKQRRARIILQGLVKRLAEKRRGNKKYHLCQ